MKPKIFVFFCIVICILINGVVARADIQDCAICPKCPSKIGDLENDNENLYKTQKSDNSYEYKQVCHYSDPSDPGRNLPHPKIKSATIYLYWTDGKRSHYGCDPQRRLADRGTIDSKTKRARVSWSTRYLTEGQLNLVKNAAVALLPPIEKNAGPCNVDVTDPPESEDQPPRISLELLDEPDGLITPADEITLRLVVENRSQKDILAVRVIVRVVEGDISSDKAVTFLPGNDTGPVDVTWDKVIKSGKTQPISKPFKVQIADEKNPWIKNNLITKGGGTYLAGKGKPDPELNVKEIFRAKVAVSFVPGKFERIRYKPILIMNNRNQAVPLAYPNLKHLTGFAPSGPKDQSDYHKWGDPRWSHLTNADIRAVAIRAATYTETEIIEDRELIDVNIKYKAFPDDIHSVVMNVVHFVHRTLYPKEAGNPVKMDTELAEWILSGKIAPENWIEQEKHGKVPFICVTHSYFLGSLLRALGVPVREVFVYEYFYGVQPYQDAASEVWYNGKWHFFALFSPDVPMTNSQEYLKNVPYYDVWVGVSAYPGGEGISRFNMWARELNASPYWRYIGLGDKTGFHPGQWFSQHWVVYTIFSPVTAVLTLPDGRRIGAPNPIDPKTYQPFKTGQSINTSGIINEIEHAYYYPEGVEVYPISEDPSSVQIMKQTFILPAQSADERNDHTITLMGTGSGGYKVTGNFIDGKGKVRDLGSFQGEVREGEKVVISGSDLQPQALPVPAMVPAEEKSKVDEQAVEVPGEWKEREELKSPDNDVIQEPEKHKYPDQKGWESVGGSDSAIPSRQSPDQSLHDSGRLIKPAQPYQKGGWEAIEPERKDFEPDSSKGRDSLGF